MSVLAQRETAGVTARTGRSFWPAAAGWLPVVPGLVWAVVRLGGLEHGPLVQLLAFTPYVAAWTLVPLGLALALRRWWAAGVATLTAVALVGVVLPRAVADDGPAGGGPTLRILTANLLIGSADPATLVGLVRDHRVDLLMVQEFTPSAQAGLDRLGLAELLPHRQLNAMTGSPGSGLYSRYPLTDGGIRANAGGSDLGFTQAYATVEVPGGPAVYAESVHPMAPYALSMVSAWRGDLRAQPHATPGGTLRILAGDFNATLDHAPLRDLIDSGYVDAADAAGAGLAGTWGPYDGDLIPPVTIDHVLVDRRIAVSEVSAPRIPGSDHRPVLAEVVLPAR